MIYLRAMSQTDDQQKNDRVQRAFNLTLAAVAGQVGCLTLVVIFIALFGGLWLDNYLQTRPLFTILFLVGSIPVTLVAMFWVVRKATAQIKPVSEDSTDSQEEADRGK